MNRFKFLRNERGLSLRGLELKTGINYSSLAKFENETREPGIDDLKTIAKFFEVSIDYMLCFNAYSIFILDESTNILFKMDNDFYEYLKSIDAVYYNKKDNRCINFEKIFGKEYSNVALLMEEIQKNKNMDKLFNKDKVSEDEFKEAYYFKEPIELNIKLINEVKDTLKTA